MNEYNGGLHIPEGLSHEIGSFYKNSEGRVGATGKVTE